LLEPFPLAVMTLALVLMAFAFAMAAFGDASDLDLRPSASAHSGPAAQPAAAIGRPHRG
jgi:hypothetical protein